MKTIKDKAYYQRIGRLGGSAKVKKGFGVDTRTLIEKISGKPKLAITAGAKGGKISKRGKNHAKAK